MGRGTRGGKQQPQQRYLGQDPNMQEFGMDVPAPPMGGRRGGFQERKANKACLHTQLRKTKICLYHMKGVCQYENDCAFAHSSAELEATPDLQKTRLCKTFVETGECDDPDCCFAHAEEELRSTNMFYKKTLCIWNEKAKCRNGDQCRFAHGAAELRSNVQASAEDSVQDDLDAQQKGSGALDIDIKTASEMIREHAVSQIVGIPPSSHAKKKIGKQGKDSKDPAMEELAHKALLQAAEMLASQLMQAQQAQQAQQQHQMHQEAQLAQLQAQQLQAQLQAQKRQLQAQQQLLQAQQQLHVQRMRHTTPEAVDLTAHGGSSLHHPSDPMTIPFTPEWNQAGTSTGGSVGLSNLSQNLDKDDLKQHLDALRQKIVMLNARCSEIQSQIGTQQPSTPAASWLDGAQLGGRSPLSATNGVEEDLIQKMLGRVNLDEESENLDLPSAEALSSRTPLRLPSGGQRGQPSVSSFQQHLSMLSSDGVGEICL